jgi:hypothetical protein
MSRRPIRDVCRDFCPACGTPLSYRKPDGSIIELLTGAFDERERVAPTYEVGAESKLEWLEHLASLGRVAVRRATNESEVPR